MVAKPTSLATTRTQRLPGTSQHLPGLPMATHVRHHAPRPRPRTKPGVRPPRAHPGGGPPATAHFALLGQTIPGRVRLPQRHVHHTPTRDGRSPLEHLPPLRSNRTMYPMVPTGVQPAVPPGGHLHGTTWPRGGPLEGEDTPPHGGPSTSPSTIRCLNKPLEAAPRRIEHDAGGAGPPQPPCCSPSGDANGVRLPWAAILNHTPTEWERTQVRLAAPAAGRGGFGTCGP